MDKKLIFAVIGVIIIVALALFFILNGKKASNVIYINETSEETTARALQEKNAFACDDVAYIGERQFCKLSVNLELENERYCYLSFDDSLYNYTSADSGLIVVEMSDLCWLKFSEKNKVNYCFNVESNLAYQSCIKNFGGYESG
ncbi:hypothetical protein J4217_04740 [Candidatus Pacearchaeota archaeon]|nr:hypothetical protein [Candidatus Pacearchaeota archaeon]